MSEERCRGLVQPEAGFLKQSRLPSAGGCWPEARCRGAGCHRSLAFLLCLTWNVNQVFPDPRNRTNGVGGVGGMAVRSGWFCPRPRRVVQVTVGCSVCPSIPGGRAGVVGLLRADQPSPLPCSPLPVRRLWDAGLRPCCVCGSG